MNGFVHRHIDFRGRCPNHDNSVAVILLLETADILAERFNHLTTGGAVFDVVTVKAGSIFAIKRCFHRTNGEKLVAHRLNVLCLEHLGFHRTLVGVGGINIPRTENHVVQRGERDNLTVVQILLVFAATHADFVILSHGADRLCQTFACHQDTRDECRADCSESHAHHT